MKKQVSKLWLADRKLVLASRSAARLDMLRKAGVPVEVAPAQIDERTLQSDQGADLDAAGAALMLAQAKALSVSAQMPERLVLGSDQTLECNGVTYAKARTRAEAAERLRVLSGKAHALHSAYCFARNGAPVLSNVRSADLTMRMLNDDFIDAYLDESGDGVLESVGVYQIEGLGVHLFERFDGDWFTILGLPLGDVLDFLRKESFLLR